MKKLVHYHFQSKYGLEVKDLRSILEAQRGLCPICGTAISLDVGKSTRNRAVVDHCHLKNRPRSILCHRCNIGLGYFDEDIGKLVSAVVYLRMWNERMESLQEITPNKSRHRTLRQFIAKGRKL